MEVIHLMLVMKNQETTEWRRVNEKQWTMILQK